MNTEISPYIDYDLEEYLLSEGIEIDEPIKIYLNEIKRIPPLTPEIEKQFLQNLDDKKTRKKLAESYLRFVIAIAVEYINNDMNLMDLIHSGSLGLMKAIESFNGNISFAEHAENSIRRTIADDIDYDKNSVHIPVFTMNTIERSADKNGNITVQKLAEILQHKNFDSRQMSAIYRFCKRQNINIIPSADPYINYDVEEILSADGVEICGTLKEYFTEIKRTVPPLTPETEKQFLQNLDDKTTRIKFGESYLRFVVMIAKEYTDSNNGLPYLIAFGNDGLTKAVDSFDCTQNISFSLLAEWLVRQEILKDIKSKDMKIPIFYKRKK